ncbi:acyltransferase family protein [Pedobacter sp. AW31-3R]|uniref:acyltransferase family protein n=1 Tax=Pedobacter sp. AW31-3R TaxID=3445781 RepID=UPI003F9F2FFC
MSRNLFIDYLKGVAIFLVVWGHGLQFLDTQYNCYQNPVFLFIYSFHMPLFMCISGYLFAFSAKKKPFTEMFKIKFKQLFYPILCWGLLFTWLVYYKELDALRNKEMILRYMWLYIRSLPYHLWFLWSLFVISLIVSFFAVKKNEMMLHSLIFLVLLFTPDNFGFSYVKFMYPFFMMGYFYNLNVEKLQKVKKYFIYASAVIFPLCLLSWSKIDLIYFTEMSFYHSATKEHLWIVLFRYLIGFTGVVLMVTVIRKFLYFPQIKFITTMGVFSLGIYIIQTVLYYIVKFYSPIHDSNVYVYTFIYTIILACVLIIMSISITKLMGRIPFLSRILFGGRY